MVVKNRDNTLVKRNWKIGKRESSSGDELSYQVFLSQFLELYKEHQDGIYVVPDREFAVQQIFNDLKKNKKIAARPKVLDMKSMYHLVGIEMEDVVEEVEFTPESLVEGYLLLQQKVASSEMLETLFGFKKG